MEQHDGSETIFSIIGLLALIGAGYIVYNIISFIF